MKFDHENKYLWKYRNESFGVKYSFANDLGVNETISSVTATIFNSAGSDTTASMLANTAASTPNMAKFDISDGTSNETYEIKIVGVTSGSNIITHYITCEVFDTASLNTKIGDPGANSYITLKEVNDYIRNVRGHSDKWDTLSIEGKKRLLIEACSDISKFNFVGQKYYDFQSLEFPRDDHDVLSGAVGTPITNTTFKNTGFVSDTYGANRNNTNYWKYGTIHITAATPLRESVNISANNVTTDIITVASAFSTNPTTNTQFIAFEPIYKNVKNAQCEQALYILEKSGGDTLENYKSSGVSRVTIGDVDVTFKDGISQKIPISSVSRKLLSGYIKNNKLIGRA
jgi:hypothetical protein